MFLYLVTYDYEKGEKGMIRTLVDAVGALHFLCSLGP